MVGGSVVEVVGRLVAVYIVSRRLGGFRSPDGWALSSSRSLAVGRRHHQGSIRPGV